MSYRIPAVVIGMNHNGLGMVRHLARRGISVIAADPDLTRSSMQTRYGRKWQLQAANGRLLLDDLHRLAREFTEPPVLLLTQESTVRTVSEFREELAQKYRFLLPPHELVVALDRKEGFQALAEQHGFAVPRSVILTSETDLAAARDLRYPCVMKPSIKNDDYAKRFSKAYKLADFTALETLYRAASPYMHSFVVQEWVEGGDADIYFCMQYIDRSGACLASFVGRKIRAWPPQVGGTASCTAAPEYHAALTELTTKFFRTVGYAGIGSMEYKRDARDGRFVMIEPTICRADYQEEVAALNGTDIPLAAYHDAAGLPPPAIARPARPQIWRDGETDRWSAQAQGHPAPGFLSGGNVHDVLLRWYDPAPWLHATGWRIRNWLAHRLPVAASKVKPA